MTKKENENLAMLAMQIEKQFEDCLFSGQTIEIEPHFETVAINLGEGQEYFFQGDEAYKLIDEAKKSKLHKYASIEAIILWQAQGW